MTQGEDHEAGSEAIEALTHDDLSRCPTPERNELAEWLLRTVASASSVRSAQRTVERLVAESLSPERNTEKLVEALLIVAATNDADLLGDPEDERTWQALDALYKRCLIATRRDWSDEYTTVITDQGREFVREVLAEYSSTTKEKG